MPSTTIPQSHSIGDFIDGKLNPTARMYQFPEDRPKYYTTITFSEYKGGTGKGGYRDAFSNLDQTVRDNMESVLREVFKGIPGDDSAAATEWAKGRLDAALKLIENPMAGLPALPPPAPQATDETMILPLPVNLLDVHKVHWDEKPIVPWVQPIMEIIGVGGTDPAKALTGLFGLAPNYFQTMLFDRPEYKRHELSFKLAPRDFTESSHIRDIIRVLNNAMSPSTEWGGFLFGFPNIVQVTLKPNNGWLFKFKPAVIEALAINYAGGEQKKAFYRDTGFAGGGSNPPESVEVTMHLVEVEYWIAGQFKNDNT